MAKGRVRTALGPVWDKNMHLIVILLTIGLLHTKPLNADSISLKSLYINPITQTRPEAIILYNTLNPCENCNLAIERLITYLKNNEQKRVHAYLINLAEHPEFAETFDAKGPLTFVIVRINDGAAFGYEKLEGLQSLAHNPEDFNRSVKEFINNFLN